ncbi:DUF2235 domain-containing protein [Erwinia pyri]|uniref:DUF2235 domain-containing protein n=1 Tax=Erwinia pyri TaxID=3062598 RepID=A0AA50HLQ0_9GAMM|nr:DUF2235 domain-containing protein [Erwinia sp. DE2]WLS78366.1 DUF2235 domain-containing protein [Erwinia sp. DE2]
MQNYRRLKQEERDYHTRKCVEAGSRGVYTCSKCLHISLFFDGTGNNEANDTKTARPPHPTNIARLYHATTQDRERGYYNYYMPGVGTPFPKIGEPDYDSMGLAHALGGENRINWALLRLVDALIHTLTGGKLDDDVAKKEIIGMAAHWPVTGEVPRRLVINRLLSPLARKVQYHKPTLLGIKLFIYGFSRGAAEARTFVNWLTQLSPPQENGQYPPVITLLGLPVTVEFLGIIDTVPSVGLPNLVPGFNGHQGWSDNTQHLPDEAAFPGFVKRCVHMVSAHEQRQCFPLDSVRRADGRYPTYATEVIYPGVHSDLGGGYPPGEQGKACNDVGLLLSQIPLHDMYAAGFEAGAPLAILPEHIPEQLTQLLNFRAFPSGFEEEFKLTHELIVRFNAWRTTLGITPEPSSTQVGDYQPIRLVQGLEHLVREQMGWLTAWRIGRYGKNTYLTQPFYLHQTREDEDPKVLKANQDARLAEQKIRRRARMQKGGEEVQGLPDYAPRTEQRQSREAAAEFQADYFGWDRDQHSWQQVVLDTIPGHAVYLMRSRDRKTEYEAMKRDGERLFPRLYRDKMGWVTFDATSKLIMALFDDHVHDSRAWFMRESGLQQREMWASYFLYRLIYFGLTTSRELSLVSVNRQLVGTGIVQGAVTVKQQEMTANGEEMLERRFIAMNGDPVVAEPGALALWSPSIYAPTIAESQKEIIQEKMFEHGKRSILAHWV